jgi:transketolase
MAWMAALHHRGPTAIILSRQHLPDLVETKVAYQEGMGRGAYVVWEAEGKPDFTIFSTGSELYLAVETAVRLEKIDKKARVVSMPCWELFDKQSDDYKDSVMGGDIGIRVAIEAATDFGWHKYIGCEGVSICMESFGASAPAEDLALEFGFTVDAILERLIASQV